MRQHKHKFYVASYSNKYSHFLPGIEGGADSGEDSVTSLVGQSQEQGAFSELQALLGGWAALLWQPEEVPLRENLDNAGSPLPIPQQSL